MNVIPERVSCAICLISTFILLCKFSKSWGKTVMVDRVAVSSFNRPSTSSFSELLLMRNCYKLGFFFMCKEHDIFDQEWHSFIFRFQTDLCIWLITHNHWKPFPQELHNVDDKLYQIYITRSTGEELLSLSTII